MTLAICLKCGAQKSGPLTLCSSCGTFPRLHSEREISLALSEPLSPVAQLWRYSNDIKYSHRLSVPDSVLAQARAALADSRRLADLLGTPPQVSMAHAPTRSNAPRVSSAGPSSHASDSSRQSAPSAVAASSRPAKQTALHRSPFWILGATARDPRRRIVELAEERALGSDPELCQKSRSDLTNPRNRLAAEMGWLPGVSPRRAEKLLQQVAVSPRAIRIESGLPALAHANLLAAAFEAIDNSPPDDLSDFILELADVVDSLDVDDIVRDINEDRSVSGFPEVTAIDAVENELIERRRYYRSTVKEALDRLEPAAIIKVMTKAVEEATLHGEDQASGLVDELVDSYEVETQGFLEKEAENVHKLIEAARASANSGEDKVKVLVDKLEHVTRNWVSVAHPIIMSAKVRGTGHSASHDLAFSIRSLAVDLYNEHNFLTQSNRITHLLQELFEHVPELAERVEQDAEALHDIYEGRKQAESRRAEWANEISYQADVGLVFKERLAISPDGISWGDERFPLDSITRIRWGGVRHSVNGIPTGTNYTIAFGDNRSEAVVSLKREAVYSTFLEKLWRAVGFRLLTEMLQAVKAGRTLRFGDAEVLDDAIVLTRRKFLGANERVRVPWSGVQIWSADGSFCLEAKGEKKTDVALSYISIPNVHLLEQAVRMAFKKGARKLSDVLEDD